MDLGLDEQGHDTERSFQEYVREVVKRRMLDGINIIGGAGVESSLGLISVSDFLSFPIVTIETGDIRSRCERMLTKSYS